ncbi:MAG: hypothetical protein A2X59_13595 [Nitrospirae bacterium GWC2_42_7]|nr:MAG: hypothetical protein A2X59_13595 [Nitrospirae bacterium GWC2_42_7]
MYVAQAFSHSLIAALIVDRAIQTWKITDPAIRQRFSLIVMVFPIFSFPLYQMINPERSSIFFRLEALFDINRWLNIELWGKVPLNLLFTIMLVCTALIFLLQEMIPIVRHIVMSKEFETEKDEEEGQYEHPVIDEVLADFCGKKPHISLIDDDELIIFSTTGKNPVIFLSTGLMETLSTDETRTAIAHELAHIARSKRPLLVVIYIIRVLMFFNPVVLVEFRRIVQEEEKICDDIAVLLTGKQDALAETLKKFSRKIEKPGLSVVKNLSEVSASLEDYSHSVHLQGRINRLESGPIQNTGGAWIRFLLTLSAIAVINYFIV